MFNPLHRLCPPARCKSGLGSAGSHDSARTAIRSRLCGPNMLSSFSLLQILRNNALFCCGRALLLSARAWRHQISLKMRSAFVCAVQTRFRACNLGVFLSLFCYNVMVCCAQALVYCAKPCLAVFCKKRDPLTPVRSKRIRPVHLCTFFVKMLCLTAPEPFFCPQSLASPNFARNAIRKEGSAAAHLK